MLVSVVIPCFYSEKTISKVVTLTRDNLTKHGYNYEFVLVNDASSDGTFAQIRYLCQEDLNIVGIDCAKNLGQHSALMAGLRHTSGEIVVTMDDDMQTDPSDVVKLVDALIRDGVDVVYARWMQQQEAGWRKLGSKMASLLSNMLVDRPKGVMWCNFCAMRSYVRDEVIRYDGPFSSVMSLINRATFSMENIEVEHHQREVGESGYTLRSLVSLWAASLGFTIVPLRIASFFGVIFSVLGFIGALFVVIRKLSDPTVSVGWPSLMSVLLVCFGITFIMLGIIGEYVGRIFMTVNKSPQYVIKEVIDNRNHEDL